MHLWKYFSLERRWWHISRYQFFSLLSSLVKHIWSIWNSLCSHATTSLFFTFILRGGVPISLGFKLRRLKKKENLTGERNVNLQKGIKITGVLLKEKRHTCRYLMENPSAYSLVDKSTNEAKVTQNMLCLEVKGFASKLHCCGIF